jgi:hypothetical protein
MHESIRDAIWRIEEIEAERIDLEIAITSEVQALTPTLSAEGRRTLAGILYWQGQCLSIDFVTKALGVRPVDLRKIVGFFGFEATCVDCHCRLSFPVKSRTELKEAQGKRYSCGECDGARARKAEEERRRQAEATALAEGQRRAQEARLEELRTMPYDEYLLTLEWRTRRRARIEEAGGLCQVCNGNVKLNVHHRTYARRGCEPAGDLLVLCNICHAIFHESGRIAKHG